MRDDAIVIIIHARVTSSGLYHKPPW